MLLFNGAKSASNTGVHFFKLRFTLNTQFGNPLSLHCVDIACKPLNRISVYAGPEEAVFGNLPFQKLSWQNLEPWVASYSFCTSRMLPHAQGKSASFSFSLLPCPKYFLRVGGPFKTAKNAVWGKNCWNQPHSPNGFVSHEVVFNYMHVMPWKTWSKWQTHALDHFEVLASWIPKDHPQLYQCVSRPKRRFLCVQNMHDSLFWPCLLLVVPLGVDVHSASLHHIQLDHS